MAVRTSDTFTRANGAMGSTEVGGQAWVTGAGWAILNNQARFTGTADAPAIVNTGATDKYRVEFTLAAVNGTWPIAAVARASSTSSIVKVYRDNSKNKWVLHTTVTATGTDAAATSPAPVAGDVISLSVDGTRIKISVNGTVQGDWTGVSGTAGGTGWTYQGFMGSGNLAATVDDFSVADFTVGTLAATLPSLSASLSGGYVSAAPRGTLAATLPPLSAALSGGYALALDAQTDTVNRINGRTRVCEWEVEVEPPVTEPKRQRAHDYATAVSVAPTTFVDGRPT